MDRRTACSKMEEAISNFNFEGTQTECKAFGNGHINDTFLLTYKNENNQIKRYILQRMNHEIFVKPVELMQNIMGVTQSLKEQIIKAGGDPERETLNVILTKDGNPCYQDRMGCYWRTFLFVEDTICLEKAETKEDFYASAVAFGHFQNMLADYPAETLSETIENFHNTAVRFQTFQKAVAEDKFDRAKNVKKEIQFALDREADTRVLTDMLCKGELPLRVTHNDTKLNNILLDKDTKKALCVIDLDTVMPGLSLYDFGDSIRFGASTGAEDETDLSKVEMSLEFFEAFTKGFLEGCKGRLTEKEVEMLPMGAKVMTYECGIRFLTDYLEGDTYFKIHRPEQNLDRCRTQFKLVEDMEQKWEQMQEIVRTAVAACI